MRVSLAATPKPPLVPGLLAPLQAAVRHVSWRVVGTTFAIMGALDAWLVFDIVYQIGTKPPGAEGYISGAIINLLMAFCIMFTTLVADELVARGAKRLPAYTWAVVIGSAAAALAQWEVHEWLHLRSWNEVPGIPHELAITQPAAVFFEYLIWGSIIVLIYVNRRTALLATARLNVARVQRTDAQRRTLESRLQALQARVEPQFLFNTLAKVRALYESDPRKGGKMLDDLIVYLRAALPHLRDSTSTVQRELELASAYLNIMQVHLGEHLAFDIEGSESARSACMPPMILLPLLDHLLINGFASPDSDGAIRIVAQAAAGKLRLEIVVAGDGFASADADGDLRNIQDRLQALYSDTAILAFGPAPSRGTRAVMEIPYEAAQRGHR